MTLYARVKADSKVNPVQACAGETFVRYEWRPVPAGREDHLNESVRELLDVIEESDLPPLVTPQTGVITIDLGDGVSENEASAAGSTLALTAAQKRAATAAAKKAAGKKG